MVRDLDYPLTHDLKRLVDLAIPEFPALEELRVMLPDYTMFAVEMRYDASLYPSSEQAQAAFETIGRLRSMAHSLLPPEARP